MKELLELFGVFAKIGAFTFGGGYAMLPIIQRELSDRRQWATEEEILDYFAIGQLTPGVIAVNVSTFIGYKRKGILGGITATLGMISCPIVIILVIATLIQNFAGLYWVKCAFEGIRVAVLALIIQTIVTMAKKGVKDGLTCGILIVTFVLMLFRLPTVLIIIGAALVGLVYRRLVKKA